MIRALPWLLLLAVAWFGGCQYAKNREADARVAALEKRNADLEDRADQVDTVKVYQTDTLRLVRRRTDSVYLTITDTLIHRDTVVRIVERERAACDAVLATCEVQVALRDSIIANRDSVIGIERKRRPDWKSKLGWLLVGAAARSLIPR